MRSLVKEESGFEAEIKVKIGGMGGEGDEDQVKRRLLRWHARTISYAVPRRDTVMLDIPSRNTIDKNPALRARNYPVWSACR